MAREGLLKEDLHSEGPYVDLEEEGDFAEQEVVAFDLDFAEREVVAFDLAAAWEVVAPRNI